MGRSDQSRIRSAFNTLAEDHTAINPPRTAEFGVRWSDLDFAVLDACDEAEMAVVQTVKHEWGVEYQMRTVEDYPGVLIVRRTGDERVYEASATIGRFGDRTDRADALLIALDRQMRAYGKKRAFASEDE